MKLSLLSLLMPLVALAKVDVAFMLADFEYRYTEAIEYIRSDQRFDRVDVVECGYFTPPLVAMQQYDVIFTAGLINYQDEFGDNLADYVDTGGFVVSIFYALCYYPDMWGIGGRWLADGYSPYEPIVGDWPEWWADDYQDLNILEPEHPIFQDVSHLSDVKAHILFNGLRPGAREIADFTYYHGIAINVDDTVVGLDYYCRNGYDWTGDGFLIMANAACWLAGYTAVREMSWGEIKASFE